MKKSKDLIENELREKKLKKRKEFLKIQRKYRLKHPLFNWVYATDPKMFGVGTWFISGFFWAAIFDWQEIPKNGLKVFFAMVITGLIGWVIALMSHRDFKEKKERYGFQDQANDEWDDKDIPL